MFVAYYDVHAYMDREGHELLLDATGFVVGSSVLSGNLRTFE